MTRCDCGGGLSPFSSLGRCWIALGIGLGIALGIGLGIGPIATQIATQIGTWIGFIPSVGIGLSRWWGRVKRTGCAIAIGLGDVR